MRFNEFSIRTIVLSVLSACLLVTASPAFAQFESLVAKVPSDANAIVLLNVEKVMSSPVAVKQQWSSSHDKSYGSGLTFLPPDSVASVLAAHLDLDTVQPLWTVAVVALNHEPSMALVERMTGGTAETIGGHPAVDLQGGGYLVQFDKQMVAAMSPTNRQGVSRWIRDVGSSREDRLSPYLKEAVGYADDIGTPVIIALDLQDAVNATDVRAALLESDSYKNAQPETVDRLVKLLTSLRGVTLGITLTTDAPFGKIRVDFGESVTMSPEDGKAMLIRALDKRGAMLEELDEWTPKVNGRVMTLEGYLTDSGVRRIASLFDRPPAFKKGTEVTASADVAPGQQQSSAQATKTYFDRVQELLVDLKKTKQRSSNYTMGSIAVWCDSFARKIDQLPSVGVDPEMASYGAYASDCLRAASSSIKTSNARKSVRQVNTAVPYDYYTYGNTFGAGRNWWGGVVPYGNFGTVAVPDYRAYMQARSAVATEERVSGANQARDVMSKLDDATGEIRRKMSMKYGVNF